MNKGRLIGLVAESHIHVGIGQAADALDLPVAREAVTRFPHVPGSGVKGALRVWCGGTALSADVDTLFGKASGGEDDGSDGHAGTILCGEARLALLPVRCTSDAYKFATCPMIVNRLLRDLKRVGEKPPAMTLSVPFGKYLGARPDHDVPLGLEEREFTHAGDLPEGLAALFAPLAEGAFSQADLGHRIVLLSDADFKWFAEFGLPVVTRNALDENKVVKPGALWSEEMLAPDTIMWMVLNERISGALALVLKAVEGAPFVQMGGNETIGQGWFSMNILESS
ncbi:MAG: type III-B CRISPR module RAMP protein Cmr4 [Rhizobiaceae bacterium]|nr:type III-B CRISPR module RAMP protein Cmr4 [Rhizobiaceae bacterium]